MKPVLRTTNLALVESARFALDSEGIPAVTRSAYAAGLPFNPVTVAVLRDADFDRALAIVDALQRGTGAAAEMPPWPRPRWHRLAASLLVLMALVGAYLLVA